jgi:hypothetical protein
LNIEFLVPTTRPHRRAGGLFEALRQYGNTAIRQYGNTALRQYGSAALHILVHDTD